MNQFAEVCNKDAARAILELNNVSEEVRVTSERFLIKGLDAAKSYCRALSAFKSQISEQFKGKKYYVASLVVRVLQDADANFWGDYAMFCAEVMIIGEEKKKTCYLAGPMRGYAKFNFPAFDAYTEWLESRGWTVISPANLDRQNGFDPNTDEATPELMREMITRDVDAICKSEEVFLMPGWENSSGVAVEIALAKFLSIPTSELGPL